MPTVAALVLKCADQQSNIKDESRWDRNFDGSFRLFIVGARVELRYQLWEVGRAVMKGSRMLAALSSAEKVRARN